MTMKEIIRRKETKRFLKWIRCYGGWWYLICTPDEKQMNPEMMKMLIERLARESFYEMIFVLLMVHRNHTFMKDFYGHALLDMLIANWDGEKDEIIKNFIEHFQ